MSARGAPRLALAALVVGAIAVLAYDALLSTYRYRYSGDSASYIDMAQNLLRDGRPYVTPWDVEPGDRDAVPQPLFPPGLPVLIAALTPLAGDVRVAALWPGPVAAALLPLLVVWLFRGAVADAVLGGVAALVLVSPGVRDWHFLAYSDVPALALAVLALGALARGLGLGVAPATAAARWLAAAGLAAGAAYAVRNAGLAVLAASVATLGYARLRGLGDRRAMLAWLAGAAVPIVPLLAYNLVTFGRLQPYDMPRSTRRWTVNVADYALAQLDELGFPAALAAQPACAIILVALIATALAAAFWRLRRAPARQGLVVLLGGYSAAGALLLVASRSRYEWGNFIDNRNVLQYTFAYALGLAVAADAVAGPRLKRAAAALGVVLLASLVVSAVKDSLAARAYHEETWLTLSRDRALMAAVRALPPDALVASNTALVFRIGVPRPVRELEVGGDDRDFRGSLGQLARAAAGRRPAAFVLVCDEWTRQFSACGGPSAPPPALPTCQLLRSEWPRAFLCEVPAAGSAPQP